MVRASITAAAAVWNQRRPTGAPAIEVTDGLETA